MGQGYVEEIAWELPEVQGDEEDILNLGEVCSSTFTLNHTEGAVVGGVGFMIFRWNMMPLSYCRSFCWICEISPVNA